MTGCNKQQNKGKLFLLIILLFGLLAVGAAVCFGGRENAPKPDEDAEPVLSFSHGSGVYAEDSLCVTISAPKGYTVAFTTDGTFPTAEKDSGSSAVEVELEKGMARYLAQHADVQLYQELSPTQICDDPTLPNGTMLCAAWVDAEGNVGGTEANVYFLGMDLEALFPGFLVVSVVTDPVHLLDYDTGILAAGAVHDEWLQTEEAEEVIANQYGWLVETNSTQHGREWERPCLIQIYDGADTPAVEQAAGIRVQGNLSRRLSQKSFNLYFRSDYGEKRLHYELFPGIGEVKSFTLRSGGNTADSMKYKNDMLQSLVSDRAVGMAQGRPAVLFLNGEYWGPYMLTEKISEVMFQDHYGVDKDQVIVFKDGELEVGEDGDLSLYQDLMAFAGQDLSDPGTYDRFCSVMDVRSFADFCAIRVYIGDDDCGNTGWGIDKNMVLWRTRDRSFNEGRWQFFLYDLEKSTGLYSTEVSAYYTNHLQISLERIPLFAAAIKNPEFRELFLSALKEIGAENFSVERVRETIQAYDEVWRPAMDDYYRRFLDETWKYDNTIDVTLEFFEKRYDYILSFIDEL